MSRPQPSALVGCKGRDCRYGMGLARPGALVGCKGRDSRYGMNQARPGAHGARGFSLLEAIVALTVFSICAMALYGWLAVNLNALARVETSAARVRDGRTALMLLEAVNPMAEPSGRRELPGGLVVRWTSTELVKRKPAMARTNSPLIFDIALYQLDVHSVRDGRETSRFAVRRAGWESVRTLKDDSF